jgi:hypothetical protein
MPLRKSAPLRQHSKARLLRYHARKAAEEYFGKKALRGKDVDHKNGNKTDNRMKNLRLIPKHIHGKRHGRGNPGSKIRDIKLRIVKGVKI